MRARWYDPSIGRFIGPDTIVPDPANPQSLNRYSYVENRPIVMHDPSGHNGCSMGYISCSADGPITPAGQTPEMQEALEVAGQESGQSALGVICDLCDIGIALSDGFQWYDTISFVPIIPAKAGNKIGQFAGSHADEILTFYHGTSKKAASAIRGSGIDLAVGSARSDFGQGFYMSTSADEAISSATRNSRLGRNEVDIVEFHISRSDFDKLSHLQFDGPTSEWMDFTTFHKYSAPNIASIHHGTPYDVVSGPMFRRQRSNGQVLHWPNRFQTSIHTERAVNLFNKGMIR